MKTRVVALAASLTLLAACSDSLVPDPNNPGQDDFSVIRTRSQLQAQATGLLAGDRFFWADRWILIAETIARNVIRFDPAEPRFITRVIRGENAGPGSAMSPSDFIGGANWGTTYANVRSANLLIEAVDASTNATPTPLTNAEKSATKGYAKTMKALSLLRALESRDVLGIVVDQASDPGAPLPPIRCKPGALTAIATLLNEADADLAAGGTDFPFQLPATFGPATDVAGFRQFNRALLAKVETYTAFLNYTPANPVIDQAALTRAENAINASFYSLTAPLTLGVYHTFSTASGDLANPLFDLSVYRINPAVASLADANDARRNKWSVGVNRTGGSTGNGSVEQNTVVSSNLVPNVHASPTSPIAIIRNAELVLLRAIIEWGQNDDAAAITNLNRVRTVEGGLAPISPSHAALPAAILYETRLSLLFESAASFTYARMLGLLNSLNPNPGVTPNPLTAWPIPQGERDARNNSFACQ